MARLVDDVKAAGFPGLRDVKGCLGWAEQIVASLHDDARYTAQAVRVAQPEDVVLIAGKGHEDAQIFRDRTVHFDDREVARQALKDLGRI